MATKSTSLCLSPPRGSILMNTFTAVKPNADESARGDSGFTIAPSSRSPRLQDLTFSAQIAQRFMQQTAQWPVQALEYKSFLRFKIAKTLDDLCAGRQTAVN